MKFSSVPHNKYEPMYGWALSQTGQPVPISTASRGEIYRCPVCHSDMVAKLGDVKQHHFAHINLLQCTPDNVARAVAGTWIANELRAQLVAQQAVNLTWRTQTEQHTINLLKDVVQIQQDQTLEYGVGDVVLLDAQNHAKTVILLGMEENPSTQPWIEHDTCVILLNPEGVRSGNMNLNDLLNRSQILGGWLLIAPEDLPNGLVISGELIKQTLLDIVCAPPYVFLGELFTDGKMGHVLKVNGKKLWLPLEVWEQAIGGAKNRLATNVQVIIQEFPQEDGAKIDLFYIIVGESTAVVVRRYAPSEAVVIQLGTSGFRLANVSALDIAKQLAGIPSQLPQ